MIPLNDYTYVITLISPLFYVIYGAGFPRAQRVFNYNILLWP
jgi:hypothetical protein